MKHANIAIFVPHNGCPQQCSFCNQKSITGMQTQPTPNDVQEAVEIAARYLGDELKTAEIAFFGGSFTAISAEYQELLLQTAHSYISQGKIAGIRISTRPDFIDEKILDTLKKYGVTTIELGAQSMVDSVLKENLRGHTASDVINASKLIKRYGFSLGLQMMVGLYADTAQGARYTAQQFISLQPDIVRIYPTVVMKDTLLEKYLSDGKYKIMQLDDAVDLCSEMLDEFEKKDINVIRLGLHDGDDLRNGIVGGIYHPAFRELCEARRYLKKIIEGIEKNEMPKGEINILVNNSIVSQVIGQKKSNIRYLAEKGYICKVKGFSTMQKNEIILSREGEMYAVKIT